MTAPGAQSSKTPSLVKPGGIGSFAIDPNFGQSHKIKVAVRMRPMLEDAEKGKKTKNGDKRAWNLTKTGAMDTLIQKGTARKVEGRTVFHFDQIFDEDTKTPLLYKSIARPMVHSVLNGKHATIFAYGQTGSGKTWTMQGDGKKQSGQAGIIQLVASDVFRFMGQGEKSKRDFVVKVCYVEVYNERIRDLLSDDLGSTASHGTPEGSMGLRPGPEVSIRTTGSGEVVMNCVQLEVTNVDEVLEHLIQGNTQRVVAKTDMNNHSSRSHAVFRLTIESREKSEVEVLRVSDFNLVDLAGSESVKISNTSGLRLREGAKINQSLLSLSTVIHNLSLPEKKRPKHINYRDSKLTRILQPHLSGNAEMAIICCATSSKAFVEESRSTLKFGARAKLVAVKPKVNEVLDDSALIKKLEHELAAAKRQIEDLKRQLNEARGGFSPPPPQDAPTPKEFEPVELEQVAEQRPPSKMMSIEKSVGGDSSDEAEPEYGYEDYGYEDMDTLPQTRAPELDKNPKSREPLKPQEPAEMERPPALERGYVMPKDQDVPAEMERDYGGMAAPAPSASRAYVMPKDHDIPLNSGMDDYLSHQRMNGAEESSVNPDDSAAFKLDAVDERVAQKTIYRYMQGKTAADTDSDDNVLEFSHHSSSEDEMSALERLNSMDHEKRLSAPHTVDFPIPGQSPAPQEFPMPGQYMNKKDASYGTPSRTAPTEDESFDGPVGSYAEISLKFGSIVSAPETLRGASAVGDRSKYGTLESAVDRALDGRANIISWDTMDLNTMQPDQIGKPLKAMQSLYKRETPLPEEITIMRLSVDDKGDMCVTDRLQDTEARASFLEGKLEISEDLIEAIFKDLERARLCIHDMVYRNVQLAGKLKEKRRDDLKEEYQEGEVVVEQYWLLKGCMYVGLFFFVAGGGEFFMATVFMVWLILETNLTA